MDSSHRPVSTVSVPARVSFAFIFGVLVLVGWQKLATPLLTILFCYFALSLLHRTKRKWLTVLLFLIMLLGLAHAAASFLNHAVVTLPKVAEESVPPIIAFAEQHEIVLPFTDFESLKSLALATATEQVHYLGNFANFAKGATKEFVFLLIGIVVAISLFLNSRVDLSLAGAPKVNLFTLCCEEIALRFRTFYASFATVMGAQIVISLINTVITAIFLYSTHMKHASVMVGVTFLCGMLPVVGNLLSNTLIVGIAFIHSAKLALGALIFLVVIHKLEYFLNSKIIGDRIKNPMWMLLLALIVGERLMGIPGMILAPVILHYVKVEASKIQLPSPAK